MTVTWKRQFAVLWLGQAVSILTSSISQYALIKTYHISPAQITRLKRNESVSTHTIEMFCKILDCEVGDIMRYIPDGEA